MFPAPFCVVFCFCSPSVSLLFRRHSLCLRLVSGCEVKREKRKEEKQREGNAAGSNLLGVWRFAGKGGENHENGLVLGNKRKDLFLELESAFGVVHVLQNGTSINCQSINQQREGARGFEEKGMTNIWRDVPDGIKQLENLIDDPSVFVDGHRFSGARGCLLFRVFAVIAYLQG